MAIQRFPDSSDASVRILSELALPQSHDLPTLLAKRPVHKSVAFLVLVYLLLPRCGIRLRADVLATVMSMPKTAVNKDGNLGLGPHEVRVSEERVAPPPSTQMCLSKQPN